MYKKIKVKYVMLLNLCSIRRAFITESSGFVGGRKGVRERGECTSGNGGGLFRENLLFNRKKNTPSTPPAFVYVLGFDWKSLLSQLQYNKDSALTHTHTFLL